MLPPGWRDQKLSTPGRCRDNVYYGTYLPTLVRTAIAVGRRDLAQRLITDHQPHTPYAHHALVTATAALAETHGDTQTATDGYADAVVRWDQFGVIPEHAYALLGHGRCQISVGQPHQATTVLHQARERFTQLGALPALTEADRLLEQATALTS